MQPLTATQYLHANYLDKSFDFLELLKALQPDPDDRTVIEQEIKDAINDIINDELSETGLKQLALTIVISEFRILRNDPITNYWNILHLKRVSLRNTMEEVQNSNRRYNTRSRDEERQSDEFHEIDGIMLSEMNRSAGSIIKTRAIKLANEARNYEGLSDQEKNHLFLGLNSICDLSNNSESEGSQKSLFTERGWKGLKNKVYVSRKMPEIPEVIEEETVKDIKAAYQLSLACQEKYAFSGNEFYFEVHSHILRLLGRHNSILNKRRNEAQTEQDYVGQVWTPIMAALFNDRELFLKWGDSVPSISTTANQKLYDDAMGDRVDMRVLTRILGEYYDVSTAEYANWLLGPAKFKGDHRKILRESKAILDNIINQQFTSKKDARRIVMPCFQASGLDGELKIMRLVTPGLYTAQYIGSIPIPYHTADLELLRTKCLPRLLYLKKHALKNARILSDSLRKEERNTRRKSSSYKRSPSHESDTEEIEMRWTRGSWFIPKTNSPIVIPDDILF